MEKIYSQPQFELVRTDGSNKVFFAASGSPGNVNLGITKMSNNSQDW